MNNTHNIPYTALKTVVHRIIQQQPTNMQQLQNIVGEVENQYRVPISLDNVNLTVKEVSLDNLAIDQDTLDECSEILWCCDSAGYPTNNQQPKASQAALDGLECLTYQALKLTTMADNILEAIYNHRDNYPGVAKQNIVDQAEDTLAECALLHQTLEDTLDDNL
ncbi:hypothetical protein PAC5_23 [Propionibacterium phage PAC5]|uniref:hypothetical protein n=1 Tax=Propionibacterium phage PAC1 TaxID=1690805 RepID=UPI0006BD69B3|nr:hypothetical protein PAC1_22 [Propionibacterium phage PAC1]ALA45845.1 hypothetical protein PAC2_23 [Propionibacterium phage PAC2]ALA45887.1 hypothetical protein PAC3_22 [Propionibacterium phage PAC3]ALA45930.1 hypothetical protein PAC4_23 [Propionibacterium phage PAC4]ALA45959.1 hypothetical protein PAC5_23 [Propionibacterium phage PAC5]ALA46015.1 hypothetical protein PAC6_22 [Propionibacterium phage PAC6]ALA46057.1 hypothetical protein PAC7_22 [Propionibacterium phage PAC7]ALA46099.1 hyp